MKTSPTQRSLALLRSRLYQRIQVVEHWIPRANIRRDLYGFIDILVVDKGRTLGFQVTSDSNLSARRDKITKEHALTFAILKSAGWRIFIHGWGKKGPRGKRKTWQCREEEL